MREPGDIVQSFRSSRFWIPAAKFAADSPLEGEGFELVWDFSCQVVFSVYKNVVIEGPPGTGKSQTITNLIAAAMSDGKNILFVSEKLAALEVVKARLTRAGLDPFVLELHSNKANKKRVLEELAKRAQYRSNLVPDLPRKLQELEGHRNELREYRNLINSVSFDAFGKTLYQVIWRCERYRMALSVDHRSLNQRTVADAREISELELNRRMDCLGHLGDQYELIGGFDANQHDERRDTMASVRGTPFRRVERLYYEYIRTQRDEVQSMLDRIAAMYSSPIGGRPRSPFG